MIEYFEDKDYSFIEVNGSIGFKLIGGIYADVIYTLSNIKFSDVENEDFPAVLSFNFDIVEHAGFTEEEFHTIEFKEIIGDILMSIFKRSAENIIESEQNYPEESPL